MLESLLRFINNAGMKNIKTNNNYKQSIYLSSLKKPES